MKVYVIGGKAKSGKNTFGEYLREELKKYGYKPCVMHITEPLYSYARNYFEYDETKDQKPREFLQKMGIEIIKDKLQKKTFLIDRLKEDIEILSNFFDVFIITDARLKIEFEELKNTYHNVVTIKLIRENYEDFLTPEERDHITETEIDELKIFDYTIKNTNLQELQHQAEEIIQIEQRKEGELI